MAWLSAGFWIGAATLAGAAALLVMLFARRAAQTGEAPNPTLAVHRRQLAEIDELADRGLIGEGDRAAARAEAGRRLLSSAALGAASEGRGSALSRQIVAATALLALAGALGLYRLIGSPDLPDQPFKARVAAWKSADPATLDPARMAAVLKTIAAGRPDDPRAFGFLGQADLAAGDPFGAERAFATAARLAPARFDYRVGLGEAWTALADGKPSPDAQAAFRAALALDPTNIPARFALGRLAILAGDRAGGLSMWRAVLDALPQTDPRRPLLAHEIARIAAGGAMDAAPPPSAPTPGASVPADATAFIQGMVAALAARLAARPDDAAGWAQLVRSYGVLHDAPAQAAALAQARKQFAGRPQALAPIEAEAKAHPG